MLKQSFVRANFYINGQPIEFPVEIAKTIVLREFYVSSIVFGEDRFYAYYSHRFTGETIQVPIPKSKKTEFIAALI